MNYKLYGTVLSNLNATQQVLLNRGMALDKQEHWLSAGWEDINDFKTLSPYLEEGINLLLHHIEENHNLCVIVDCDDDGYTSSAILLNYLYKTFPEYYAEHVSWIHHAGKEHGFKDLMEGFSDVQLIVSPDGGTNDFEEHKTLAEKGIDILVLDHHLASGYSENGTIINIQLTSYQNKDLTGAGVVWQFCRALDETLNAEYANDFLDLCALGNIGDMASAQSMEIRAICNIGLSNITNPFFKGMATKNDYSIQKMNGINYYSIAFYVVPFINAICRSGTLEEKEIVFSSMLESAAYTLVDSSKRGCKGEKVPLWEEGVLVAERVKRRQTKIQDEMLENFKEKIESQSLLDNEILLFLCEPGEVERSLAGLVANKCMAKFQRPCLVLTKTKVPNEDKYIYSGSARNYSRSEITELKPVLEQTGVMEFCAGHNNAFGCAISQENIKPFIQKTNEIYSKIDTTSVYWVDYIWNEENVEGDKVLEIGRLALYGQDIPESLVCVENICLSKENVTLMSPDKHPTLKINLPCGVSMIKFKSSQEEYEDFTDGNKVMTAICKCNVNEWQGRVSPQLLVEDFDVREEWIF